MSGTGVGAPGFGASNLAAVARDDELLELLGARSAAPCDDHVATLLAALVRDVDDGLAELLAGREEASGRELAAAAEGGAGWAHGRRLGAAVTVVALGLSVSGVAAAVTGDPLAAYKGIVSVVTGEKGPSPNAAPIAHLNAGLRGTRAKIAHGDLAGAQSDLDRLKERLAGADLTSSERAGIEARIAALEKALARAKAKEAGAREPKAKDQKTSKRRNDVAPGAQQRGADEPSDSQEETGVEDEQGGGGQSAERPTDPGKRSENGRPADPGQGGARNNTQPDDPQDEGDEPAPSEETDPGAGDDEDASSPGGGTESGGSGGQGGGKSAAKHSDR